MKNYCDGISLKPRYEDSKDFYFNNDEYFLLLRSKMLEDPEAFIKLATLELENPYVIMALYELPLEHQTLLLPYLNENSEIADVAYDLLLHLKHPETFSQALYSWDESLGLPPAALIIPAIQSNDLAMIDVIADVATTEIHRQAEIFEALSNSDFRDMIEPIANDAWTLYENKELGEFEFDNAVVAARFAGNREALMECLRLYRAATPELKPYYRSLLIPLLSYHVDVYKFEEVAEELVYNAEMRWWSYPL